VCNAIAGRLAQAGVPSRQAAPQPGIGHPEPRTAAACPLPGRTAAACPSPGCATRARRPGTAAPAQSARPGWLARLLRRRPAPSTPTPKPTPFRGNSNAPFTQEEFPGLSPEACAFFSTPLEDLDPEILHRLLGAVAATIADRMPPELGLADPQALFATLCGRFGAWLGASTPEDAPPILPPDPPQDPRAHASPAGASPNPPPNLPPNTSPIAPRIARRIAPPPAAPTPGHPQDIATAPQTPPAAATQLQPASAPVTTRTLPFQTKPPVRRPRPVSRAPRPRPPRHSYYAARASPA